MADGYFEPEALGRLMAEMRPRLHRYCARMVGSAFDGEDVVQEALAKAAEAFPGPGAIERPESWLFASPTTRRWTPCAAASAKRPSDPTST